MELIVFGKTEKSNGTLKDLFGIFKEIYTASCGGPPGEGFYLVFGGHTMD